MENTAKYTLLIKISSDLPEDVKSYYLNYKTTYEGDSGIDLVSPNWTDIHPWSVGTINFGIQCEMINNQTNENVSYYLYPRSSISKTPLMMANSVGIIDAGYRGNIMAKVRYLPFVPEQLFYTIEHMTKLFQICAPDLSPVIVQVVDSLSETKRGAGGFGSTGK